jgi:hypothetical protein
MIRISAGLRAFMNEDLFGSHSVSRRIPEYTVTYNRPADFPGGKARPGRDADHSPPSSAEVKYE